MYTPSFDELAGGDDRFFPACFGRAPLYRPAALTGDPRQILSIADLDDILHFEAIRPPYIRVMKDGVMVPHVAFTETTQAQGTSITDTVVPETVYELLRTGATVTWPALNHLRPNVRALTRMLAAKFATETNATAFLTPPGGRGINPQHANFDVFVIQLEGTTAWTLWPRPPVRRAGVRNYLRSELGEPALEVTLRPGDVLYLPWGTPNQAAGAERVSLHLAVMVRVRLWSDLLRLTVERLVADERFWQAPYLNGAREGEIQTSRSQRSAREGEIQTSRSQRSAREGEIQTSRSQRSAREGEIQPASALAAHAALLAGRLREIDLEGELRRLIALGQPSLGNAQGSGFQAVASAR